VVPVDAALVVEVDAGVDQHDKDHCDDPVDDQGERRPPASVSNILAAVLPQVLEPMAGEAATSSQAGPVTPAAATTTKAAGCRPRRRSRSVVPHLVALVRAGASFDKGVLVERPDEVQKVAA
jgi:hypothetical protein